MAVLGAVMLTHRYLLAPGRSAADYDAFVSRASYYAWSASPPQS